MKTIAWSPQQLEAIDAVNDWYSEARAGFGPQVFYLAGYAGTGKTTLAMTLVEKVEGTVFFAAYTGKAAHILGQKGCPNARTLHSLIYTPRDKSEARLVELRRELARRKKGTTTDGPMALMSDHELEAAIEKEKRNLQDPDFTLKLDSELCGAALLVVDECSMVDAKMGGHVLSFNVPVLVLGDPGQLPPIKGGGFFTEMEPDVILTEIHRQAEGDPIITLATQARNGQGFYPEAFGESAVVTKAYLKDHPELALDADQIIVGKNATRRAINARVRQLKGFTSDLPQGGDRVICLRNNRKAGLLNGSIWLVKGVHQDKPEDTVITLRIVPEDAPDSSPKIVRVHVGAFLGQDMADLSKADRFCAQEFDFGYAITCHKSQGSQWDSVLVFEESWGKDAHRHRYTAVTRAAKKVVIAID